MELYLVQHGEAKSEDEDPERSLTEQGMADVERVAVSVARIGLQVCQIRHSGKRRAEQTALILDQHLSPSEGTVALSGLAPRDDVEPIANVLKKETRPVMLVGHLPFLDRLTSLLVTGKTKRSIVQFRYGGIVCLRGEGEDWAVAWIITPECIA